MAITDTINNLLPSFASDVVAIFTQDFFQIFPRARAMKAVVKEDSKPMEHPLETGATITDHRIILPTAIELSIILQGANDYTNTYNAIRQYFLNGTLLVIQTKTGIYPNQMIVALPHEEDPEQYDAVIIALKLKQVQFARAAVGTSTVVPKKKSNSSTVKRGVTQPRAATPAQTTAAQDIYRGSRSFIRSVF